VKQAILRSRGVQILVGLRDGGFAFACVKTSAFVCVRVCVCVCVRVCVRACIHLGTRDCICNF
jgi:hypothetical protein